MTTARTHMLRCVRSNVALSAEVAAPSARRPEFTSMTNLSGTGCLLANEHDMKVGEVVFMRFSLPGQVEVETTARVARVDATNVGVAFQDLSELESERIVRHVVAEGTRRRR